ESTFETAQPTFLGDYTWLTVLNGKAYGAWTAALPTEETEPHPGRPPRPLTIVRVGTADFSR
ncbi:MAG TPA: hypothetical protein VFU48_12210, partial [Nitrospira sp.]|nr:hypothetical protein [Nitrospira sp.]